MRLNTKIYIVMLFLIGFESSAQSNIDTISVDIKALYDKWSFTKEILDNDSTCVLLIENADSIVFSDTIDLINKERVFVDWVADGFVSIGYSCGSYCWSNRIIELNTGVIHNWSYMASDTSSLQLVNVIDSCFVIYSLKEKTELFIEIPEYNCIDGFPFMKVVDLTIHKNVLRYYVYCEDGRKLYNTINF